MNKISKYKKCPFCGEEILIDAVKCKHCLEFLVPQSTYSNVLPRWKFIFLSIITFGFYNHYRFYKSWKFLKDKRSLTIFPFWRAIFAPLRGSSLAVNIKDFLNKEGIELKYNSVLIGVSFFILFNISPYLPGLLGLLFIFSFIPIIPLVDAMNKYWKEETPNLPIKKFTWWQRAGILIRCMILLYGVFS